MTTNKKRENSNKLNCTNTKQIVSDSLDNVQ